MTSYGFDEYQKDAAASCGDSGNWDVDTLVIALGVGGEAGEVQDIVKKAIGHGHSLSRAKLAEEIGDTLWYLAILASRYGLTLESIARLNRNKLLARYPDGFSQERSINREQYGT